MTFVNNLALAADIGARVVAAIVADDLLDLAPGLEVPDLVVRRQALVLSAARNLRATGVPLSLDAIGLQIEFETATAGRPVGDAAVWTYLGLLMIDQPKYLAWEHFTLDVRLLRKLAVERAQGMARA